MKTLIISILCFVGISMIHSCSSDEKFLKTKTALTEEEFVSLLKFKTIKQSKSRSNPTIPPTKKQKES